ncbi:MAG: uracil-DNA glycosylase [Acidobacteria bacterium]|nr:uracil-DNA glycosylase [Acidobacteriota bacterium]
MTTRKGALQLLSERIIACERCARLIQHCRRVAREKRRMYSGEEYWGRPVPGFGDPHAELLILGLAPAAHGANRTGRMFTGDRSGEFLYRALHEAGFASQADSMHRHDGLRLINCYITASLRCAPPGNKPLPAELRNCRPFLEEEVRLLGRVRAVLALGRIAFDTYLGMVSKVQGMPRKASFRFAHGASYELPGGLPRLFASYRPSQQNTQTGRLTRDMLTKELTDVRLYLGSCGKTP